MMVTVFCIMKLPCLMVIQQLPSTSMDTMTSSKILESNSRIFR
ncbi:hypothetical protein N008_18070 [Hymenobacter sp. APR13]|nr:hypothetical protein N008_18070 [Hymenobacter sp. APR13]